MYSYLSDVKQAKNNHARVLEIRLKHLGSEHVDVAASYNCLGTVYCNLNDFQQAKENLHVL